MTRQQIEIRRRLERAVERAIAALDAFDGDADYEAQCEDEGFDADSEPNDSPFYGDYHPEDQRRVVTAYLGGGPQYMEAA